MIHITDTIEEGDYPKFVAAIGDELFEVDCSDETDIKIVPRSNADAAKEMAEDAVQILNRAVEEVGPRYVTDIPGHTSLSSLIA
jgi:hypothetical protein